MYTSFLHLSIFQTCGIFRLENMKNTFTNRLRIFFRNIFNPITEEWSDEKMPLPGGFHSNCIFYYRRRNKVFTDRDFWIADPEYQRDRYQMFRVMGYRLFASGKEVVME